MCGIIFSTRQIKNSKRVLRYLKYRGPDCSNLVELNGLYFLHCLLSMTGKFTPQPFIDDEVVTLFNGEIYNFDSFGDNFQSDGECLIPAYRKYGIDFVHELDGEYAVILVDFKKEILIYSSDVFGVKPFFIARENGHFALASYESCLHALGFHPKYCQQVDPNTATIVDIRDFSVLETRQVFQFDLTQKKKNYDDWEKAFQKAIWKRTRDVKHGIFMGLSSGYDSGCIAAEMTRQGITYTPYSIVGHEDEEIIKKRSQLHADTQILYPTREQFIDARDYLKNCCEEYYFKIDNGEKDNYLENLLKYQEAIKKYEKDPCPKNKNERDTYQNRLKGILTQIDYRDQGQLVTDDNGSIGVSHICQIAKLRKQIIYISGSGADEIFSDYGFKGVKHQGHSTIGGLFPKDLSTVFPWKNFFLNTQRAYLMKEEMVTGSYGVEGRFPFLDKMVVQEFLWLVPELKNKAYKSPLHHYMTKYKYPFKMREKVGFNCGFTNIRESYASKEKNQKIIPVGDNPNLKVDFKRVHYLREQQKKQQIDFPSLLIQRRHPMRVIVTSTQTPGNGGSATNAYKLIRYLRTFNIACAGIFFLCNREDPTQVPVDPEGLGGIYHLRTFWKDGSIEETPEQVNNVREMIKKYLGGEPNMILAKNILAPISCYRIYPKVTLVYLVSGVSNLTILNNNLLEPMTAQEYLSYSDHFNKMMSSDLKGYQNVMVEYITLDICDLIITNSRLTYRLMASFFPEYQHKFTPPLNTSVAVDTSHSRGKAFADRTYDVMFVVSSAKRKIKNPFLAAELFSHPQWSYYNKLFVGDNGESLFPRPPANCTFKPRLPNTEVLELMRDTRVVILPSLFDSSPNTLYEALQSGCNPLISENIGNADLFLPQMVCRDASQADEWLQKLPILLEQPLSMKMPQAPIAAELYRLREQIGKKDLVDKDCYLLLTTTQDSAIDLLDLQSIGEELMSAGMTIVRLVLSHTPKGTQWMKLRSEDYTTAQIPQAGTDTYLYDISRLRKNVTNSLHQVPDYCLALDHEAWNQNRTLFPESYHLYLPTRLHQIPSTQKPEMIPPTRTAFQQVGTSSSKLHQICNLYGEQAYLRNHTHLSPKEYEVVYLVDINSLECSQMIHDLWANPNYRKMNKLLLQVTRDPKVTQAFEDLAPIMIGMEELPGYLHRGRILLIPHYSSSAQLWVQAFNQQCLPLVPIQTHFSERLNPLLTVDRLDSEPWMKRTLTVLRQYDSLLSNFQLFQKKIESLSERINRFIQDHETSYQRSSFYTYE